MRVLGIAAACFAALAIAPGAALAAPAAVAVDQPELTLVPAAQGWATLLGITNLTDSQLALTARTNAGCLLTVGDGTTVLQPARHSTVAISIPAKCKTAKSVSFVVTAQGGGVTQRLALSAAPKTSAVFWSSLLSFVGALGGALLLVVVVYVVWLRRRERPADAGLLTPLKGLDATWSFQDSVVSNVTAAGGVVAVVLGSSDFLKAVLGGDAEAAIAVASIAGVVALALVGAAGVIVLTVKRPGKKGIAIAGLCAGYVVALAAAGGQVWALTLLVVNLDIGFTGRFLVVLGGVCASTLLATYGAVTLRDLLIQGTEVPKDDPLEQHPLPVEIVAAAVGAATAGRVGDVTHDEVEELVHRLEGPEEPAGQAGNGRASRRPAQRQALLHAGPPRSAMP